MRYNTTCQSLSVLGTNGNKMDRAILIQQVKNYFDIKELVCPHVYQVFGELSWGFFREDYLDTILFLRRHFGVKMYCNYSGMTQRGVRCNICKIVKEKQRPYLSGHVLWCAGDWTFEGYEAEQIRHEIKSIAHLLPCPVRLERSVTWVHIDTLAYGRTGKITGFNG